MATHLLGREAAIAALHDTIDRAVAGSGGTLLLVGEAGLGKTALLDLALAYAERIDTAQCRGEPDEQGLAFGLVDQLEHSLGINDAGGPVVDPAGRHHRLLRRLEARSGRPLLVLVDDLHWSDADSLVVFGFLARRVQALGLTLIAALRPWPVLAMELANELAGAAAAEQHRLEPLDAAMARRLLSHRVGSTVSGDVTDRALTVTGGNPLLLTQVAHVLEAGGTIPDQIDPSTGFAAPLLLARFSGLDAPGVAFARAASVLGVRFRVEVAAAVAVGDTRETDERTPTAGDVDRAVETLERGGLLVDEGKGVARFVHPLFAQALYDDTPRALRARLHARAFAVLADRGLEREAAEHAEQADLTGDASAVALLRRVAAAALADGAVVSATQSLRTAIALSGDRPEGDLRLELAQALAAGGHFADVVTVIEQLLATPGLDRAVRRESLRLLGRARYLVGAPDRGDAAFAGAIAIAEEDDPAAAVDALLDQSLTAWLIGGTARALPLAERARSLAVSVATDRREVAQAAWAHLALEGGAEGGVPAGQHSADTAAEYVDGVRPLDLRTLACPWAPVYHAGMDAAHLERLDEAERVLSFTRVRAEEAGAPTALATLSIHLANVLVRRGRLTDALAEAVRAEEFADLTPGITAYAQAVRAEALVWLGRLEESEACCAAVEASAPGQWFADLWLAHVRGMRLLWADDPAASDVLLHAEQLTRAAGIREPCHLHWAGHAMVAHVRAGHPDRARSLLAWLQDCAAVLPCRWPRIAAAVGQTQLALSEGRLDDAEKASAETVRLHQGVELPLLRVEAEIRHGELLARGGRSKDARSILAGASADAERLGSRGLAVRAGDALRLAGGRRRRAERDTAELTAAERRAARLAASGRSNAEIATQLYLSVNTVETHLKHVYAKLGINSRRQLMTLPPDVLGISSHSPESVTPPPT